MSPGTTSEIRTSVSRPSRRTTARDCTRLPSASTARVDRRSRTYDRPTLRTTMALTTMVDFHSAMTPAMAAMTRSWTTSGLRHRSRRSSSTPLRRACISSFGPYSSRRRAASSEVSPSKAEPSPARAAVAESAHISWSRLCWRPGGRTCVTVSCAIVHASVKHRDATSPSVHARRTRISAASVSPQLQAGGDRLRRPFRRTGEGGRWALTASRRHGSARERRGQRRQQRATGSPRRRPWTVAATRRLIATGTHTVFCG